MLAQWRALGTTAAPVFSYMNIEHPSLGGMGVRGCCEAQGWICLHHVPILVLELLTQAVLWVWGLVLRCFLRMEGGWGGERWV